MNNTTPRIPMIAKKLPNPGASCVGMITGEAVVVAVLTTEVSSLLSFFLQ